MMQRKWAFTALVAMMGSLYLEPGRVPLRNQVGG